MCYIAYFPIQNVTHRNFTGLYKKVATKSGLTGFINKQ